MAGWGGNKWGTGSWGSSIKGLESFDEAPTENVTLTEGLDVLVPYKVSSASSLLSFLVRVDFSAALDLGYPPNFDAANYSIPGLTVLSVAPHPTLSASALLLTTEQVTTTYTVIVDGAIQSSGGDPLDPAFRTATFLGSAIPPSFQTQAQSRTKIRLTFAAAMEIDSAFEDPGNYVVAKLDGTPVAVSSVTAVPGSDLLGEMILAEDLDPLGYYTVTINSNVTTTGGQTLSPNISLFQWEEHIPSPIVVEFGSFSGEVSGGLLGDPDGQVFFSPAYDIAVAESVLEVDQVDVCTRAYDVYQIPSLPDPPVLYTYPAPSTAAAGHTIGATGAVIFAPPHRLGLADVVLYDLQEDTVAAPADGPCDATLVETIDITSGGFTNDVRWETFPAATASIGVFTTAANLAPIGPGPTTNINLQP